MISARFRFAPEHYETELEALIADLDTADQLDQAGFEAVLRRHPKDGRGFFSKSEIIQGFRHLNRKYGWRRAERAFVERIRMKPVRTLSGVAPVTVLTKPFPCPGRCIFCPSDVRMPKSYLADEPGAQRAAQHRFDPYAQTLSRLLTLHNIGHEVDKVELNILGGTWTYYPEDYKIWFVLRCFEALNDFSSRLPSRSLDLAANGPDFSLLQELVDGRSPTRSYNRIVSEYANRQPTPSGPAESAGWGDLRRVQKVNETAEARCVGLAVETRPDYLSLEEVVRIRRLGATRVQIGYQSLSDEVLRLNRRGHDVAATRRAMRLLRAAGFKIHAHWMPNLYGSSPELDMQDFGRIFSDPDFRPDELKIYPCSLIDSAELVSHYDEGLWRPYDHQQLLGVLTSCLSLTPPYCRLTRVIRDIPSTDIVAGNKKTNFRELAELELSRRGLPSPDIRAREVREQRVDPHRLRLQRLDYATAVGTEVFLQLVTPDDRLAAFLRLSMPQHAAGIQEIRDSALIREVHVYGRLAAIGDSAAGRAQHTGLGRSLIEQAELIAKGAGYPDLAVISSVGTREYYRGLGFADRELYQHRRLPTDG